MLPLHCAIEDFDQEALVVLLRNGADPDQPDPDFGGFRPLQLAVDIECEEACRRYDKGELDSRPRASLTTILVNAGASPDLSDAKGLTARALARDRMHMEALTLFGDP
ncbi:MAG: ankyrin repeat protein [Sphingomonas bacterium]|uniref:hypothetical protein n=1 Tax=Sphingomonas bacterium TaxID=1895847 RepID=UPI0026369A0A|nr:hypothetical protein [Sphingomonas bacterium]MDB5703779.1 ankyrin repeat protein [Sphingomonas bacterium]